MGGPASGRLSGAGGIVSAARMRLRSAWATLPRARRARSRATRTRPRALRRPWPAASTTWPATSGQASREGVRTAPDRVRFPRAPARPRRRPCLAAQVTKRPGPTRRSVPAKPTAPRASSRRCQAATRTWLKGSDRPSAVAITTRRRPPRARSVEAGRTRPPVPCHRSPGAIPQHGHSG
jgi:hypothetical protein